MGSLTGAVEEMFNRWRGAGFTPYTICDRRQKLTVINVTFAGAFSIEAAGQIEQSYFAAMNWPREPRRPQFRQIRFADLDTRS